MPMFRVYYTTTASSSVMVEAADASEAREKADEVFEDPSICAQCSGWGRDYDLDLGEWNQDDSDYGVSEEEN